MGYYDGFSGDSNYASTHHVASIKKSPVILILDASKTVEINCRNCFRISKFHKHSRINGIILNKIGSKNMKICAGSAFKRTIPIVGIILKIHRNLESRHLGLILDSR